MQIDVKDGLIGLQRKLDTLSRQTRFATAVTLTRVAQDVRAAERQEMQRVFDRPTRYTLNSLYVSPATKTRLEARVWVKDSERPSHYLLPEIYGGPRANKRFEDLLRQANILRGGERTVPGEGAKIDANGNMARSQIVQILSQLQAFNTSGFDANATGSRKSKAKRAAVRYFYAREGESRQGRGSWKHGEKAQHLRSGIYVATGGQVRPVLVFVKGAKYKTRFRFFEVAQRTVRAKFDGHFARAYADAMRTAKWGRK
jgi:hypothetical protein